MAPTVAELPDLDDMMRAGMGLTDALAFWSKMVNDGKHSAAYWWEILRDGPPASPLLQ